MPTVATTPNNPALDAFIAKVVSLIIMPVVTLLAVVAVVVFIWGVVDYVRNADNDEARKKGQEHILWGLIGMMIMFGTTAIISILQGILVVF